jgi:hypothetical protein
MLARKLILLLALHAMAAAPLVAQHAGAHADSAADADHARGGITIGAHAIGLVTHARPAIGGRTLTEGYLTQPMLSAHGQIDGGLLRFDGVLNLEGLTLGRGELNAGIWGEGYIDRRHPHTYLHEAVATLLVRAPLRGVPSGVAASLAGGRGFVPFGTDDPMVRPFVKYPSNHHLAQVLERWVLVGGVRAGPLMLEAALLNGDEPTGPTDLGGLRRFGDSWASRVTLVAPGGIELQASRAEIASPELRAGGGNDHAKTSASARWEAAFPRIGAGYGLLEWARTDESADGRASFRFTTVLGEAGLRRGSVHAALRLERTDRPEEERGFDPFRTPAGHVGPLLGVTRWTVATARIGRAVTLAGLGVEPFAEAARLHLAETHGGIFDPVEMYGADRHWSLSAGVRLAAGAHQQRMGRYGVAAVHPQAPAARPPQPHHD